MENKLQELTNKLYEEGLSKGRTQAEALLNQAQEDANGIIEQAKKEAAVLIAKAQQEATELKEQVDNEIRMASRQTVSVLKQKIESLLVCKAVEKPTQEALSDKDFVEEIIKTLVAGFNPKGAQAMDLNVVLPQEQKENLSLFLKAQISKLLGGNVSVSFSSDLDNGFSIGPKDGGYQIRFTDRDFIALFSQYLRPKTKTLLYGE